MTSDMIELLRTLTRERPWTSAALLVAAGASLTILGAYFFQYVVGLAPCPLCLEQRTPYYVTIPLALVVAAASSIRAVPGSVVRIGLLAIAAVMLWGAGLGIYHAGAEWAFWQGPTTCAQPATIARTPGDLLRQLQSGPRVVDCTVAAWRFLGLSLAGWNVVVAVILAAIALAGASRGRQAG
ncbi:disulfide bond formation protein B [Phreatobacter aquaticus]|uniref:Disulfide bond formation protein B n=1 Tax=Phreatobacter aquaticus TaxID=2570229 RepID=A0A4D7QIC9_9HYPH|nr:disulfide bond formation protein B [Phreatobacter aquaticus]QCK85204.1 disulfide bond formation protein B [Phreatobacter aquaticus]